MSAAKMSEVSTLSPNMVEVPAIIRSSTREERHAVLQLSIGMSIANSHTKLSIEVTDETDPFFYYQLECDETEFHRLKQEQSIIVDFQQFPGKFVELLDLAYKESPTFACIFLCDIGSQEGTLSIVETNRFKQLTHLSLRFRSGNDEILKVYLAGELKKLKHERDDLLLNLNNCRDTLDERGKEIDRLTENISILKHDNEKMTESLEAQKQREIKNLQDNMEQRQNRLYAEKEEERANLMAKFNDELSELKQKLAATLSNERDLVEAKLELESTTRELTSKVKNLEHEGQMMTNELEHLRSTNKNLDSAKFDQEKTVSEQTFRIQALERELRDKEDIVEKMQFMLKDNGENKTHLEDHVNLLKTQTAKLEEKLHASAQEINKGNQIIQKLQSDIKGQKNKVKFKNTVVQQQEQLIQQKENQILEMERSQSNVNQEKERQTENYSKMEKDNEELRVKLEESSKNLEANQAMITYLNKQLNEKTVRYTSTYQPTFKPSERSRSPLLNMTTSTGQENMSPQSMHKITQPIVYREPEKY